MVLQQVTFIQDPFFPCHLHPRSAAVLRGALDL